MNWSHGYHVSTGYSFGHYREMAPDWMRFGALLNGYRAAPPDQPFRYLELGCGQGFALAQLAAAFPHAEFLGVDFNPEHIAQARRFALAAGLENIRFEEADIAELAKQWPADYGRFEYVALHGLYSWVSPPLRRAVVSCLGAACLPGALVYLSYNSMPGWVAGMVVQRLVYGLQQQSPQRSPAQVLQQGAELLEGLIQAKAKVAAALPTLSARLEGLKSHPSSYLVHEYLHEHWQPLWHSEVAAELHAAKLIPVGSATLAENYLPALLQPELAQLIGQGEGRAMQQTLIDLAINQSFRRDLFCRGARHASRSTQELAQSWLLARQGLDRRQREVMTGFGGLDLPQELLDAVVDALESGSERIGTLAVRGPFAQRPIHELLQIVALLLHAGRVGLAIEHLPAARVRKFNRAVVRAALDESLPYGALLAAATATAREARDFELALYPLVAGGAIPLEPPALAVQLRDRLLASGRTLLKDGQVLQEPAAELAQAQVLVDEFLKDTLPDWQRQGVV